MGLIDLVRRNEDRGCRRTRGSRLEAALRRPVSKPRRVLRVLKGMNLLESRAENTFVDRRGRILHKKDMPKRARRRALVSRRVFKTTRQPLSIIPAEELLGP